MKASAKKEKMAFWESEEVRKNGVLGENLGNCYKRCHGCPGLLDLFEFLQGFGATEYKIGV